MGAKPVSAYLLNSKQFKLYADTDGYFQMGEMLPVPGTATEGCDGVLPHAVGLGPPCFFCNPHRRGGLINMATSTLIQFLGAGEAAATSNRTLRETYLASGTLAVGDLVALDLTQTLDADKLLYVIGADSGTAAKSIAIGVATAPAVAGGQIEVLLRGIATVKVDGSATAIAAGDALVLSGVKLVKAVAGEGIVAQSLVAVTTDTTAKVYVLPRF
jgi:hypothetical protein